MTNVEIMVSRIMIMIMNRYQTVIPIDKAKVVTKQQNKTKDQTIQYGCLEYPSIFIIRIKKRNLTTNIRRSQLLTKKKQN